MDHNAIEWDPALTMNHQVIDEQHQTLIGLVAALGRANAAAAAEALHETLRYAGTHFRDEEKFMAEAGYPGLAAHRAAHKELTRTLLAYAGDFSRHGGDLYSFRHLMFRWVRDHILEDDLRFARFLAERTAVTG